MTSILTSAAYAFVFILSTIALSLGAYFIAQRLTRPPSRAEHKDMAGSMVARIGALHGLILALVFAQELAAYQRIEAQAAVEASAVADLYNDAARYDVAALTPLRLEIRTYLGLVLSDEWARLGQGHGLSDAAWTSWERAYEAVLDLEPGNTRQQSLRANMLDRIHAIAQSRDIRASEAGTSIAHFFWFAALSGVVLIASGHYIYPARRHNLVLLALFSAYTGLILFLIYGLSNPFSEPAALSPVALLDLAAELELNAAIQ